VKHSKVQLLTNLYLLLNRNLLIVLIVLIALIEFIYNKYHCSTNLTSWSSRRDFWSDELNN